MSRGITLKLDFNMEKLFKDKRHLNKLVRKKFPGIFNGTKISRLANTKSLKLFQVPLILTK